MNNNIYLIPANASRGKLILNIFRGIDLAVFLTGIAVTLIFFIFIPDMGIVTTLIKILPISVCSFLVVPVPFYHNVMCFIKDVYIFLVNRRVYYWKGWCVRSEYSEK